EARAELTPRHIARAAVVAQSGLERERGTRVPHVLDVGRRRRAALRGVVGEGVHAARILARRERDRDVRAERLLLQVDAVRQRVARAGALLLEPQPHVRRFAVLHEPVRRTVVAVHHRRRAALRRRGGADQVALHVGGEIAVVRDPVVARPRYYAEEAVAVLVVVRERARREAVVFALHVVLRGQ